LAVTSCWAKGPEKSKPDIHQRVTKLGVGSSANVTLTDGSIKKGTIKSVEDQSFTLDGGKKAGVATISYSSVASVHQGGLPTAARVAILAGVVAVIAVAIAIAAKYSRGGGSLCPPGTSSPCIS
jgi:hypothetical protein